MTRQTSKDTYKQIKSSGSLQKMQWAVYDLLYQSSDPMTGAEINNSLGSYSGHKRLSELRRLGVIEECEKRLCGITGRNALTWTTTNRLPVKTDPAEKPRLVIKCYESGRVELGTTEFPNSAFNQAVGVKITDRGAIPNGRSAAELKVWKDMDKFSLEAKDLNTRA